MGVLLAVGLLLAVTSLLGDSATYDETSHLTAGYSYLVTGDFRLAPDHPPLPKLWAAWPLLMLRAVWVSADDPGWVKADPFLTGRRFLFELNDGPRLIVVGRCMMLAVLVATWLAVYGVACRLFGRWAGLLSLMLAVLSPTLLAHGRLITTDVPIALCALLSLASFARLVRKISARRFIAAAVAIGASAVSKLSWPLIMLGLAATALAKVLRPGSAEIARLRSSAAHSRSHEASTTTQSRRARICSLVGITAGLAATTWAAIWTCYGWRASMLATAAGESEALTDSTAAVMAQHWSRIVYQPDGSPRPGALVALLRFAADYHLLPDAYLFGIAWVSEATATRSAYFCGQTGPGGWHWYFPLAFVIKTPIATSGLILAGILAILLRRARPADPELLIGLGVFVAAYSASVISSSFNIGHRHLLPIYPPLFVLAGGCAAWLRTRAGRLLIPAALLWLAVTNLRAFPHYLSYFNELVGGPARGHLYLADSNLDWGQDLKRLARFASEHPGETLKLSYFGSAPPAAYGFRGLLLPSSLDTGSAEHLEGGGTYVISVTNLLGVYDELAQDSFWNQPQNRRLYAQLWEVFTGDRARHAEANPDQMKLRQRFLRLRWGRFLYNLRHRPPDSRIGWSLFVYRLSADDVEQLTRP